MIALRSLLPGGGGSETINSQYSASTAAAQAFIYIFQDISQSVSTQQNIRLDCGSYKIKTKKNIFDPGGQPKIKPDDEPVDNTKVEAALSNLKKDDIVYTGCGYIYLTEEDRNAKCGSGGTSKWVDDSDIVDTLERGDTVYNGCGYTFASEGARDTECTTTATHSTSKWMGANPKTEIVMEDDDKFDTCFKCYEFWLNNNKKMIEVNKKIKANSLKRNTRYKPLKPSSQEDIRELCTDLCECKLQDIDMEQKVMIKFDSTLLANASSKFLQSYKQNVVQQANSTKGGIGGGFLSGKSETDNTSSNVNNLFQSFSSSQFQESIQQLSATQSLIQEGPGTIQMFNMEQTVDAISKIMSTSNATSTAMSKMETDLIQAATTITESAIDQLIIMILKLIMNLVTIGIMFYASSLFLQAFSSISTA